MKVVRMSRPIPDREEDRAEEAQQLLARLKREDYHKLTTWEVQLLDELNQELAVTRIRLKELREIIERLYPSR